MHCDFVLLSCLRMQLVCLLPCAVIALREIQHTELQQGLVLSVPSPDQVDSNTWSHHHNWSKHRLITNCSCVTMIHTELPYRCYTQQHFICSEILEVKCSTQPIHWVTQYVCVLEEWNCSFDYWVAWSIEVRKSKWLCFDRLYWHCAHCTALTITMWQWGPCLLFHIGEHHPTTYRLYCFWDFRCHVAGGKPLYFAKWFVDFRFLFLWLFIFSHISNTKRALEIYVIPTLHACHEVNGV